MKPLAGYIGLRLCVFVSGISQTQDSVGFSWVLQLLHNNIGSSPELLDWLCLWLALPLSALVLEYYSLSQTNWIQLGPDSHWKTPVWIRERKFMCEYMTSDKEEQEESNTNELLNLLWSLRSTAAWPFVKFLTVGQRRSRCMFICLFLTPCSQLYIRCAVFCTQQWKKDCSHYWLMTLQNAFPN